MAEIRVNPTRMELKKLQVKYTTARRGHKLLKDKRDELMRKFLDVVREDKELREHVEEKLAAYHKSFSVASAMGNPKMLAEALILSGAENSLEVSDKNVMSVFVPVFELRGIPSDASNTFNYGFAFTSGEMDSALYELSGILPEMVRMAELEKAAQLLAGEIERTRRRVNALEHIMMPRYQTAIKQITMKLDENERGSRTRLMKVKDMMIAAQVNAAGDIDDMDAIEDMENAEGSPEA